MVGPALAPAVLQHYSLARFDDDAVVAFATMMSDRNVTCSARRFARAASAGGLDLYLYRFAQRLPEPVRLGYGVYHTTELVYLFQHLDGDAFDATDDDRAAATTMLGYWTRFARAADPNGPGAVAWSPFTLAQESFLRLAASAEAGEDLKADDCDFWDGLLAPP
jgi:para-nitrobenzyl esterase